MYQFEWTTEWFSKLFFVLISQIIFKILLTEKYGCLLWCSTWNFDIKTCKSFLKRHMCNLLWLTTVCLLVGGKGIRHHCIQDWIIHNCVKTKDIDWFLNIHAHGVGSITPSPTGREGGHHWFFNNPLFSSVKEMYPQSFWQG